MEMSGGSFGKRGITGRAGKIKPSAKSDLFEAVRDIRGGCGRRSGCANGGDVG